jgi:hypothetical protein
MGLTENNKRGANHQEIDKGYFYSFNIRQNTINNKQFTKHSLNYPYTKPYSS